MKGDDGRSKYFVDSKLFSYFTVLVLVVIVLAVVLYKPRGSMASNCADMNIKGYTDVTPKNHLFNPALDKNHDGVEC